jgi:DNA-binding NarL/FixJ family response regulator
MEMSIQYAAARPMPSVAQLYGGVFHAALIVADDPFVADRMRRILAELAPHRRVVVASGRAEALNLLAALPYDLLLVDMQLPGRDGVSLLQHVRQSLCAHRKHRHVGGDDHELVSAAIGAGAIGYLLTEADDFELSYLLRSIERGGSPMDSRIARRIVGSIAASAKGAHHRTDPRAGRVPRRMRSRRRCKPSVAGCCRRGNSRCCG